MVRTVPPHEESRLKKTGSAILGATPLVVLLLLVAGVLRGMVWSAEKLLPWLISASRIAFDICVFVLLPLCLFRKTRPWAGLAFYFASYSFGAMLFSFSCLFAVYVWGYGGLAVGLVFAGAGVVPVAFLAALLHREWAVLLNLVLAILLTFGTRFLGIYLSVREPAESL